MISVPSFAKINIGLKIGPRRSDGFHELRTIYQTLALHDVVKVDVQPGSGIEIRCKDPRVPCDQSNTCWKIAERLIAAIGSGESFAGKSKAQVLHQPGLEVQPPRGKIVIAIEKRLPVQGGLGAASSNAVAAMLGLERVLGVELAVADKLRIAAEVGSDLPLFLIGGTALGTGRGEEVYPLPDLPALDVVVVTPEVGISTPKAFDRWDESGLVSEMPTEDRQLTGLRFARTMNESSERVLAWLEEGFYSQAGPASGVPAEGGDRAETPLLDLVRAGIENDFERVVFPEYPELREVKELLQRQGAQYASLSGSGSTVYGLFGSAEEAQVAAERLSSAGHAAAATRSLTRDEYWKAVANSCEPPAASH